MYDTNVVKNKAPPAILPKVLAKFNNQNDNLIIIIVNTLARNNSNTYFNAVPNLNEFIFFILINISKFRVPYKLLL
jgi:hypothetical protein